MIMLESFRVFPKNRPAYNKSISPSFHRFAYCLYFLLHRSNLLLNQMVAFHTFLSNINGRLADVLSKDDLHNGVFVDIRLII